MATSRKDDNWTIVEIRSRGNLLKSLVSEFAGAIVFVAMVQAQYQQRLRKLFQFSTPSASPSNGIKFTGKAFSTTFSGHQSNTLDFVILALERVRGRNEDS